MKSIPVSQYQHIAGGVLNAGDADLLFSHLDNCLDPAPSASPETRLNACQDALDYYGKLVGSYKKFVNLLDHLEAWTEKLRYEQATGLTFSALKKIREQNRS